MIEPTDEDINIIVTHPGLQYLRTRGDISRSDRMLYEVCVAIEGGCTLTINGDFDYVIATAAQLIRDKEGK